MNMNSGSGFDSGLYAGRQVLVVGGSSGIGAGIAAAFAAHGASVRVTGATAGEVERFMAAGAADDAAAQRAAGLAAAAAVAPSAYGADGPAMSAAAAATVATARAIQAHVLDVRDASQVQALFGSLPRLDVLVNCAGVIRRGEELQPEVFADVLDINLNGAMRCCAAARGLLAAQGGCIVNTASMLSFFGGGLVPAYSASKGGVAQLTKSLAIAYADQGIRVNALAPGWIATPLTAALQGDEARSGAILARTPMKRWGTPGDVAGAALFLCSPAASFITGVILPVDGGYLIN
jgi:NAD(P)-dependent dehydrogenase (short-subunit alcohol dehydrogenase family)